MHFVNLNFNQFRYLNSPICYAEYGKNTFFFFFQINREKSNERSSNRKMYLTVKIRSLKQLNNFACYYYKYL